MDVSSTARYPAAETAKKHERILDEAARLFREKGFSGVSVGEIMKATGLTHGPFYNHFDSKEELMAESVLHGFNTTMERLDAVEAERRNAAQRLVFLGIIIGIDVVVYAIHWRIARKAEARSV